MKATPLLAKAAHTVESELELEHRASGSILRAIAADGDVQHGKTPYFVLVDELHVWKNRRLWRALKSGLLKIPNTLLVIITTAGRGHDTLAHDEYQYARKVAAGEIEKPVLSADHFRAAREIRLAGRKGMAPGQSGPQIRLPRSSRNAPSGA